jgi:hypothetical protein
MRKNIIIGAVMGIGLAVGADVVVDEDFSGGQGSWATRAASGGVIFTNGAVNIAPSPNGQPGAAYLSYTPTTLADGETLRLTVDVSTTATQAKSRDVRMALGFADPLISGDSTSLAVPLSGYLVTLPTGDDNTDSRVTWNDGTSGDINFFNYSTQNLGDLALDNNYYVDSTAREWIFEITRSGNDLIFSGSFDGSVYSTSVTAAGVDVIPGFEFNTVGLAYAYNAGETVTYDNLRVEKSGGKSVKLLIFTSS